MNLSNIMTRIKLKLGLINIATPFENLDDTILSIITDITIPTFSIYYPSQDTLNIDLSGLEEIEKTPEYRKVLLPDFKTRKLLYVLDVKYRSDSMAGIGYYDVGMLYTGGYGVQQLITANMGARMLNNVIPKMTFKFDAPRTLTLFNAYTSSSLQLLLGFEHDKSLASIPESCREEFIKLAILDVKENLYPTLKQYSEINTALGTINLKLDEWADADNMRKDLIDKWDDTYHLDFPTLYYG